MATLPVLILYGGVTSTVRCCQSIRTCSLNSPISYTRFRPKPPLLDTSLALSTNFVSRQFHLRPVLSAAAKSAVSRISKPRKSHVAQIPPTKSINVRLTDQQGRKEYQSTENPTLTAAALPETYQPYALQLAQRNVSTPLYIAPSQAWFFLSSYTTSIFCFSCAYNNYGLTQVLSPNLPTWISPTVGLFSVCLASLGAYFTLGPTRLIRSITAVPKPGAGSGPKLDIQVELRKMIACPEWIWPRRVLTIPADEITLEGKLYKPTDRTPLDPPNRIALRPKADTRQRESSNARNVTLLATAARGSSKGAYGFFVSMRRIFTRAGFMSCHINGQRYKLDISGGEVLDEGRAIDRLFKTKLTYL